MYTISAIGQDSHKFTDEEKPLLLGGVLFEGCRGLAANSDGDVVLHALTNAVSGLTAVNVLGAPADAMCRAGITDSAAYLQEAFKDLNKKHMELIHISFSIECKTPKISPKIVEMREKIGALCRILPEQIGITATSGEELTCFGRGEGIAVICAVTAAAESEYNKMKG
ncbi:MAG: 2-C-methyl-D-erythritol 2,4-cyclodiphosphate synthase [Clostridia bacterium]